MYEPSLDENASSADSERGFIGTLTPCVVHSKDGHIVWDNEEYGFLKDTCPPTVDPKLWRQSQLCAKNGLFEVTAGIYQIRGLDLSNMTIIEGKSGLIIVDPLVSVECAEAALELYRKYRGNRPVKAVLYSHSHVDHFGGAVGVLPKTSDGRYDIPIIAPEGFMEETLGENIFAGPAMRKRAVYMYGGSLPKSAKGQVGCGLGLITSNGTVSLIPPNDIVQRTGEERTIDGVQIVFQMVPGTEAPSEFNLFFPDHRALYIAECATHSLHNIITLRGALVRDAKKWSKYLDETRALYGGSSDVLFSGHHWPTWDTDNIVDFVSAQRDLYAYLHDQTVRLMNQGLTGVEIAEQITLAPTLQRAWHAQGFYGSVSHNVKGIYQRYMTWFDGNPANLWKHTPAEEGRRYIACMGGVPGVMDKANSFAAEGDLRFAATLLDHAVAAEPSNQEAKTQLANVYEQLGFGAENATWRNFYLTGAQELRKPSKKSYARVDKGSAKKSLSSINPQSTVEHWLDALSVNLDGPRASEASYVVVIDMPDESTSWILRLNNGTLTHRSEGIAKSGLKADLIITLKKTQLYDLLTDGRIETAQETREGNLNALTDLLDLCGIKSASGVEVVSSSKL